MTRPDQGDQPEQWVEAVMADVVGNCAFWWVVQTAISSRRTVLSTAVADIRTSAARVQLTMDRPALALTRFGDLLRTALILR